jgi:serine/threonine protein kinase
LLEFQPSKRFRLVRRLGEGAMGVVHEALDAERGEHVAIKVLSSVNARSILRFKREFRALQEVQHPNLVTLGELVSEEDTWFFTMELVHGDDFVSWCTARPSRPSPALRDEPTAPAPSRAMSERPGRAPFRDRDHGFDERRLRTALAQLSTGLCALHDAQKIHRDIKPSNVLVDGKGRVVVLDFGLVADIEPDAEADATTDMVIVGTPTYMAPEQAASRPVGPEADWYSVGVLLFEVLTGDAPFAGGTVLDVLRRKQAEEPPAPSTLASGVPADLNDLCVRLLKRDPTARPSGRQVLRALGVLPERRSAASLPPTSLASGSIFVGREAELGRMSAAYQRTREGECVTVLVRGESGLGKSRLARYFADMIAMGDRNVVVLAGRCYERETVPYKALDGVIDAFGRFLSRISVAEADSYRPTRPGALVQAFPVLRRVMGMAQARDQRRVDPHELRRGAFAAIRDMLTRLAERRPVIVLIDDLQWADADSLAVLAEVLRPPGPPPLLLLGTTRVADGEVATSAGDDAPAVVRSRAPLGASLRGDVQITLGRLTRDETRALAEQLLAAAAPGLAVSSEQIAREADGYPIFVDEMVRHAVFAATSPGGADETPAGSLSLEDALWGRIAGLDGMARSLVELLAVAGSPLPLEVVSRALRVDGTAFARVTSLLRVAHLVRSTGVRAGDRIELYHGRIRVAVLAHLDLPATRAHHALLAAALETLQAPDAEALAAHWLGAGNGSAASKYMLLAAERASDKLAFDHAAELYTRALDLRTRATNPAGQDDERSLAIKLGDALAKAGRGPAAAEAYQGAARGANAALKLDLDRRSAEQLLRSGHFDAGLAALRVVLTTIGLELPESRFRVIVELVVLRLLLRLRGIEFRERDASEIAAHRLMRLDVLWSLAFSIGVIDVVRARLIQTRYMLAALRTGEPTHIARAAAFEVTTSAQDGTRAWKRTLRLIAVSTDLARRVGTPYVTAWAEGSAGIAHYLRGSYREALARCLHADEGLREHGVGTQWEVATLRIFAVSALALLGRFDALAEHQQAWVRDALDRGDLYAAVNLRVGFANTARLVAGDPAAAREDVARSMRQWSKQGTHLEHFYELVALVNADLYEGKAADARARIERQWRPMHGALLTMVQTVRIHLWRLRGQTTLALAAHVARAATERSALLAQVVLAADRVERERAPWGLAFAKMLRAGIAGVRNETDRAIALYDEAARAADETEMAFVAAVARRSRGLVMGGDAGRTLVLEAEAWMTRVAVRSPARLAATVAPWVPDGGGRTDG